MQIMLSSPGGVFFTERMWYFGLTDTEGADEILTLTIHSIGLGDGRFLVQVPVVNQKLESGLVVGHFQSTAEVPMSKILNPRNAP